MPAATPRGVEMEIAGRLAMMLALAMGHAPAAPEGPRLDVGCSRCRCRLLRRRRRRARLRLRLRGTQSPSEQEEVCGEATTARVVLESVTGGYDPGMEQSALINYDPVRHCLHRTNLLEKRV